MTSAARLLTGCAAPATHYQPAQRQSRLSPESSAILPVATGAVTPCPRVASYRQSTALTRDAALPLALVQEPTERTDVQREIKKILISMQRATYEAEGITPELVYVLNLSICEKEIA